MRLSHRVPLRMLQGLAAFALLGVTVAGAEASATPVTQGIPTSFSAAPLAATVAGTGTGAPVTAAGAPHACPMQGTSTSGILPSCATGGCVPRGASPKPGIASACAPVCNVAGGSSSSCPLCPKLPKGAMVSVFCPSPCPLEASVQGVLPHCGWPCPPLGIATASTTGIRGTIACRVPCPPTTTAGKKGIACPPTPTPQPIACEPPVGGTNTATSTGSNVGTGPVQVICPACGPITISPPVSGSSSGAPATSPVTTGQSTLCPVSTHPGPQPTVSPTGTTLAPTLGGGVGTGTIQPGGVMVAPE